jgi:zinc transport system substrate-binding protein
MTARIMLTLALLLAGSPALSTTTPVSVAVSVAPQAYLVDAVGGAHVTTVSAVGPGESPHVFDPTPSQVARLATAQLYVAAGLEVEVPLLPRLRAMNAGLVVVPPPASDVRGPGCTLDHDHDHAHGHDHARIDPHYWLDPRLAAVQAEAIAEALARHAPALADTFSSRARTLGDRLVRLHDQLADILAPVRGQDLVVAHPAFGHLAATYGLEQVAVEHEGHAPSPRQLAALLERLRENGTPAVFVQPQVGQPGLRSLADAAGVELVTLDPLAYDYPANMRHMARAIAGALTSEAAPPANRDGPR